MRPLARKLSQYYWYPRFSPDGRTVLAKHLDARPGKDEGDMSVRLLALDGSEERSIVLEGHRPEVACWSPDGAHIAVAARDNVPRQPTMATSTVLIVDSKGSRVRTLTLVKAEITAANGVEWTAAPLLSTD